MNGKQLFEYIDLEETNKALEKLETVLHVCASFKSAFFDYKARANTECSQNQWRIQNNALFVRLDAFLERCHDVVELTKTILQFNKLSHIEVFDNYRSLHISFHRHIYTCIYTCALCRYRALFFRCVGWRDKRQDTHDKCPSNLCGFPKQCQHDPSRPV
jgi:hypothetical protein